MGVAAGAAAALIAAAHARPRVMPTLTIVSGTPQTEQAYATSGTSQYLTDFARPLVVRVVGKTTANDRVEFTCLQPHCGIRVYDADNDPGKWPDSDDHSIYDEVIKNGTSTVRVSLTTDLPGTFTVVAQAIDGDLKGPRSATFVLISR